MLLLQNEQMTVDWCLKLTPDRAYVSSCAEACGEDDTVGRMAGLC